MDSTNANGGNAKVARDDSNLDSITSMPELQESENKTTLGDAVADTVVDTAIDTATDTAIDTVAGTVPDNAADTVMDVDMDGQEVNGDLKGSVKKNPATTVKTKLRKFKANSTSSIENDINLSITREGRKRKLSEPDDASSEESIGFNGFDLQGADELDTGSHVLRKLIAEAEIAEAQLAKRCRYMIPMKNYDGRKDDDQDSDDNKMRIYEMDSLFDIDKIKKERESDSDSIGLANSIELDMEQQRAEESSTKSVNSSSSTSSPSGMSLKSKGGRMSRAASPGSAMKQKLAIDMSDPAFKEPFKYGWKRELVYRASNDSSLKRMADIYYYTPKGKKVRSFREVAEFLHSRELTIDNFTFFKEPIGLDDPDKEIIRDAKRIRGSIGLSPTPSRRSFSTKKAMSSRKPVEEQVSASSPASTAPQTTASATPAKTSARSPKTPSSFKVKVPAKKTPQITEIKPSTEEKEMLPPQRNATSTRRSQQAAEKATPAKSKRLSTRQNKNKQESNIQQHFMDNVCAGYHALLRIFQYLKVQELLRASRVCKMWRDLAAHPSLWKTVRMKNSQVTDWDGLADTLQRHGTQHLDLRKMLVAGDSDGIWRKFLHVIPRVTSLVKLELCRCPVMVVEEVIRTCPQLQVLSAMSIKCDTLNLKFIGNIKQCQELRFKAISGMSLLEDLTSLKELTHLTHLSLTSVKELGKKKIDTIQLLVKLETLELGECSDFPDKFGTSVLMKLQKLERLRLEKGQGSCCTFDILEGVSKLPNLNQMELVNFDVKNGFDKCLARCRNIKRLLIIPTYISQSATSNNMVLGGVTELSHNLTHFVWGVTLELLRVTELFVDQCNLMNKQVIGDSIPVLKPVPCLRLIEDVEDENDNQRGEDRQLNMASPQVDILPLPQLQKLLLTALPKTRVKILKIPFHATWRQSISDTTSQ
ncbi:PREDICTED: muscle M-line assembly protein unc-89 isoform X5 [Polistes canadensis]|uniref:muscle M-line assembly protein unc-89 isoform X5 n=1 Tax=Polistes canadensis TaxID=91411 RepID=UPI000718CF74|nr:PREDICTED: muscle M-line assembly protein unc-89 isoform X5 [Polistes canadensis]